VEAADEGENWKLPRITAHNCESNLDPLILPKPVSTRSEVTQFFGTTPSTYAAMNAVGKKCIN